MSFDTVPRPDDTEQQLLRKIAAALGASPAGDETEQRLLLTIAGLVASTSDVYASQAEAEAGTNNTKVMTPLRTAEAIAALGNDADFAAGIALACSDETTALTTGTAKVTVRVPYAFTVTGVFASVTTAPVGSKLIVDINEAGTSILSTKLSIDSGEKSSDTAVDPPVVSDTSIAAYAEITIDIDQIGSSTAGAGLKVWILGVRA